MFIHPLLPLHVPSRPLPRRVESLAGPTLPGHYVCTPAAAQESFPSSTNDADGYFALARFPTPSSFPDTPGSCYSQNSQEDDEDADADRLPPAPVRPLSFPPARAIPARKPKSRALADVRRLEAAAERWTVAQVEGARRHSYPEARAHWHPHSHSHSNPYALPHSHVQGSATDTGSPEGNASGSTPSIYDSPEHHDYDGRDPMILAWTSPAPVDLAAAVVEEHVPQASPNALAHLHHSEDSARGQHFNVALLASWGILPSMCKGVSLL